MSSFCFARLWFVQRSEWLVNYPIARCLLSHTGFSCNNPAIRREKTTTVHVKVGVCKMNLPVSPEQCPSSFLKESLPKDGSSSSIVAPTNTQQRSVDNPWLANGLYLLWVKHFTCVIAWILQFILSALILCRHKIWVELLKPAPASLLLLQRWSRKPGFGRCAMSHPSQRSPWGSQHLPPRV